MTGRRVPEDAQLGPLMRQIPGVKSVKAAERHAHWTIETARGAVVSIMTERGHPGHFEVVVLREDGEEESVFRSCTADAVLDTVARIAKKGPHVQL